MYSARDKNTVRISTFACGLVMLLFSIIPVTLGMAAYAIAPDLPQQDLALPYVMKECMPFWASALALAAIFSAEISAADEYIRQDNSDLTEFENRYERLDIPYRVKRFLDDYIACMQTKI